MNTALLNRPHEPRLLGAGNGAKPPYLPPVAYESAAPEPHDFHQIAKQLGEVASDGQKIIAEHIAKN